MNDKLPGIDEQVQLANELTAVTNRSGLGPEDLATTLRALASAIERAGQPVRCSIVPFVPGRRPTDEIDHPGLGSSDATMVRLDEPGRLNVAMVLADLQGIPDGATVEASVALVGRSGTRAPEPLAGWERRPLDFDVSREMRIRIDLSSDEVLAGHDLGLGVGLLQGARVTLRVVADGYVVAADEALLDVCDIVQLGELYARVIDRVVTPDTTAQAAAAGVPDPGATYHPWYPVLLIGGDKAALYTKAIVEDIVDKGHQLTDPAWLLRVGIYLELLTCLGIAEAVRDDVGDLLDPDERAAADASPELDEIRDRLDVAAWRGVWAKRRISFARFGAPRTGPVAATNLLTKRNATMAFLHTHHEDLKHAIELAGRNGHNAQETWQRVFRDAERAVLRKSAAAFPELAYLPESMREQILWQRRSIGDQQGLYATACVQYRSSMNHVADWAKTSRLMDHTGSECIPTSVSLLHAHMHESDRVAVLQRGDGYGPSLELTPLEPEESSPLDEVASLLAGCAPLALLSQDERLELAATSRPILLSPAQRLLRQDDPGESLFVIADGELEVVLRSGDGRDTLVASRQPGEVVGEMALITGDPRAATVRAGDEGALVYEIGRRHYGDVLIDHPELVDALADLMDERLAQESEVQAYGMNASLRERIRSRFFGNRSV